jgi:hypothetical protein
MARSTGIEVDRHGSGVREAVQHSHADPGRTAREVEHLERHVGLEEHAEDVEHHGEPFAARLDDPVLLLFPALEPRPGSGLVHALSGCG